MIEVGERHADPFRLSLVQVLKGCLQGGWFLRSRQKPPLPTAQAENAWQSRDAFASAWGGSSRRAARRSSRHFHFFQEMLCGRMMRISEDLLWWSGFCNKPVIAMTCT